MLKRLLLLVRLDLKVLFNTPWTYIFLPVTVLIIVIFFYAQPENRNTRIIVVDEMRTSQAEKIVQVLLDEDYVVEKTDQIDQAFEKLKRQKALAILHIQSDGKMSWLTASPGSTKRMRRMLDHITTSRKTDIEKDISKSEGMATLDIAVKEDDLTNGRSIRIESTAYISVWIIWFLSAVWTLILMVALRDSYFKLARKYSAIEIFSSKVISGLVFGTAISTVCWSTCEILGVEYSNILALIYCSFWVVLLGLLFGLLAAVIPLSLKTDATGMVMLGMMMIFVFFLVASDASGSFTSMSLMPVFTQKGALWNFLFLLNTLTRVTIFPESGFFTMQVGLLTRQLACIAVFEALACFVFLSKR